MASFTLSSLRSLLIVVSIALIAGLISGCQVADRPRSLDASAAQSPVTKMAEITTQLPGLSCAPFDWSCWVSNWTGADVRAGQLADGVFENLFGARSYSVYVPHSLPKSKAGLIVMLHGCFQNARDFADQTQMNQIAEKYGFVVLYPEQSRLANIDGCWNWFEPINQMRDSGEMSIVVGMVQEVARKANLDPSRVYVAGLSAGGAMAANLLGCYSDLFSGGAIASGMEFVAATTAEDAKAVIGQVPTQDLSKTSWQAARCAGPQAKPVALYSIQGTKDPYVIPSEQGRVIDQFTQINDILDDGIKNGSETLDVISQSTGQVPGGYAYTTAFYGGQGRIRIEAVTVEGMAHAWSGAATGLDYSDPKGPQITEAIWQFLDKFGHR